MYQHHYGFGALPINVLAINVLGSFALGVFTIVTHSWNLEPKYSLLVAIGFCGSFTTMSSFVLESSNLLKYWIIFGCSNIGKSINFYDSKGGAVLNANENVMPYYKNKKERRIAGKASF